MTETFEVGQKVKHRAQGEAEVTYGPYDSMWGSPRYVVRFDDGREAAVSPQNLSAIPEPPKFAVGDKVTPRVGTPGSIVAGPFTSRGLASEFWVVEGEDGKHNTHGTDYLTKVDEDTYTHDGVTYALTAKYRDRDGDVWRLARINDVVRARMVDESDGPTTDSNTLATVAGSWGPLTRVTD